MYEGKKKKRLSTLERVYILRYRNDVLMFQHHLSLFVRKVLCGLSVFVRNVSYRSTFHCHVIIFLLCVSICSFNEHPIFIERRKMLFDVET